MKIKGYEISPEFDPSRHTYSVEVVGKTSVDVEYKLTDKNSKVTIEGADNLKVGKNAVEVIVTEKDGTITTYTVNVTVGASSEQIAEENNNIWLIVIVILILLIVIETAYIVVKKKKSNK